jgi:hypothetical protein
LLVSGCYADRNRARVLVGLLLGTRLLGTWLVDVVGYWMWIQN